MDCVQILIFSLIHRSKRCLVFCMGFFISQITSATPVINEFHYNPPDDDLEDGVYRQFIELYNPDSQPYNLTGCQFQNGIDYSFPSGTQIQAGEYLIIAKDPTYRTWHNRSFRILGPFEGKLSNSGEIITLTQKDGSILDQVQYGDSTPWSQGADGYGPSLERIAWDLPSQDFHSWRASLQDEGTPGVKNSVNGTPPYPVLFQYQFSPAHPKSSEPVLAEVIVDSPDSITSVTMRIEPVDSNNANTAIVEYPMVLLQNNGVTATYQTTIPPYPTQTYVRTNIRLTLQDGKTLLLPHLAEPSPFLSYFVYDGEITTPLPILWLLSPKTSSLLEKSRSIGAAVCLRKGVSSPDVFDGALVISSASDRLKVRFLKGEEFYGDRTINIIPETPTGGTNAGISSPYREHLGFWFYREMDVPSCWANFFRVISIPQSNGNYPTQRLIIQQVNEQFLALNGLNPEADLYKLVYSNPNWEKHTNKAEGTGSIEKLLKDLSTKDLNQRRSVMENSLMLDEFLRYSTASVLTSNWDGFWNNNWMYLDPATQKWEIFPWDLDWLWGSTPPPNTGPMYARMPLSFPIDGVAIGDTNVSRSPGPVTAPIHKEPIFYADYVKRLRYEMTHSFTEEKLFTEMDNTQEILLDDLRWLEKQTGRNTSQLRVQITESYDTIKKFVTERRAYLDGVLPLSVQEWELHDQ